MLGHPRDLQHLWIPVIYLPSPDPSARASSELAASLGPEDLIYHLWGLQHPGVLVIYLPSLELTASLDPGDLIYNPWN